MFRALVIGLVLCSALAGFTPPARAATPPSLLNYQGVLRDSSNAPLSGSRDMVFSFFDTQGATNAILLDAHTAAGGLAVTVTGGLFSVQLGGGVVTDGAGPGTYTSLADMFRDYAEVWLEIHVGGETLAPRIRVVAAAYALNADHLDGKDSAAFAQLGAGNTFATGTQIVQTGAVATKGVVVRGASGQSANLQEWQDSAGSALAFVNA